MLCNGQSYHLFYFVSFHDFRWILPFVDKMNFNFKLITWKRIKIFVMLFIFPFRNVVCFHSPRPFISLTEGW